MRKSLELQCLVVGLVDFLELLMFINAFLPYILMKRIGNLNMENILYDTAFLKNCYERL